MNRHHEVGAVSRKIGEGGGCQIPGTWLLYYEKDSTFVGCVHLFPTRNSIPVMTRSRAHG